MITNDKDFGEKVFREQHPNKVIILLRLDDDRWKNKIKTLKYLLENNKKDLPNRLVVVTENRIRSGN